jgi:serine/threonine protein kinase/tetratricopeptide (TPR) repeat protein
MSSPRTVNFWGTERFAVVREIGAGGMGVVYDAIDRTSGAPVALKTLKHMSAMALYRFKQEFRSLAELVHPNLVPLYELVSEDGQWFFSMERIDGVDFLSYVCPLRVADAEGLAPTDRDPGPDLPSTMAERENEAEKVRRGAEPSTLHAGIEQPEPSTQRDEPIVAPARQVDEFRLRSALAQLAEGVQALHAAGKLHRDIKPSNVLITREGRVVLLDFGLVAEMAEQPPPEPSEPQNGGTDGPDESWWLRRTRTGSIVGTVGYMAPEQAAGKPLTEASDWYAVGVMLYQALCGQVPFPGSRAHVLYAKQEIDPPPPSTLAKDVPEDLNALCVGLLRRDPSTRLSGKEILDLVRGGSTARRLTLETSPFIGRQAHLDLLDGAFRAMLAGRAVTVAVHGRSGAGKSALIRHFVDGLAWAQRAIVLSGRCYEQESVPYKALDSLIDDLTRLLLRMPRTEVEALMPEEIGGLAHLFPVLLRVDAVARASERSPTIPEAQELRRHAFSAFRELLTRLGSRYPLILYIDDLQWGDADSAALLMDLLKPPDPPRLLLLAAYRSEHHETSACLRALHASGEASRRAGGEWFELRVDALTHDEARTLALALLSDSGPAAVDLADRVARESGGSPFFIYELAEHLRHGGESSPWLAATAAVDLDEVLWNRVEHLPSEAKALLELVAVAGRPLRLRIAYEAEGRGRTEPQRVAMLRASRLIRTTGPSLDDDLEAYHDRIRESVLAHLSADVLGSYHGRLADALVHAGDADAETIATHFLGSNRRSEAAVYYEKAAEEAARALAFERAAKLFRLALELGGASGKEGSQLRARLAEALANAGRGAESARDFATAADDAEPAEALRLMGRAAYQYCISGRVDEGLAAFGTVLGGVGLAMPKTPARALGRLLASRAALTWRGLGFQTTPEAGIDPSILARIDVSWAASTGLTVVDTIRAAVFQTTNLRLALGAGEPARLAVALAWEAAHASVGGTKAEPRVERLLQEAAKIAGSLDNPYVDALILLATGASAHHVGRFVKALDFNQRAEQLFRQRCTGVAWELGTAQTFGAWELFWLGDFAMLVQRAPALLKEARDRGDLYLEANLSTFGSIVACLMQSGLESARAVVHEVMGHWSRYNFHTQHFLAMTAELQLNLYAGDGEAAWEVIRQREPELRRSLLLRVSSVRTMYYSHRGLSALAAADTARDPAPFLREASRDERRLRGEGTGWSFPLADLLAGSLASRRGDATLAASLMASAAHRFDALGMKAFAAAARHRRGEILGGTEGGELVARARAYFEGEGVREVESMIDMHAPKV